MRTRFARSLLPLQRLILTQPPRSLERAACNQVKSRMRPVRRGLATPVLLFYVLNDFL